ncbi:FAD-dependent monooxygenase [Saccharopolyspora erythraea]|uniref:FAD-dependent monooxygenase n=1 Tax=Saccharopolyspora erythraea TaxID=1836 RepID=UPI0020133196|nr:FAD-dependent monooxygenase [Saccharopolyspora erythraea]
MSARNTNSRAAVIVVGAGPVGLSAVALRSYGLEVTVLEADPANRVRQGNRALFVHRESLALLDRASPGLASAISGVTAVDVGPGEVLLTTEDGASHRVGTGPPAAEEPHQSARRRALSGGPGVRRMAGAGDLRAEEDQTARGRY